MERKVLDEEREVILKVKDFCELEKKHKEILIPLNNVQMRVAAMTGVSVKTVSRITKEGKIAASTSTKIVTPGTSRPQPKKIDVNDFDLCAIRQKIHFFYVVKKELPTVNKLRLELKDDINFRGSNTTLRRILKQIGFRFKRCESKCKVLVERYDITAWRGRYIQRMKKNRLIDKKPVVYLDDTYIHPKTYQAKSFKQDAEKGGLLTPDSAGKRFIIAHVGLENEFVQNELLIFRLQSQSSDDHGDMKPSNLLDDYIKWLTEKVVPNLPEKSLIVMDTAPSLLKKNKDPSVYAIDELLTQHNHEVVRLPPYHCDINPIEKIWRLAKMRVAEKSVAEDPKQTIELIEAAFGSITAEDWRIQCEHVKHVEDQYLKNDQLMEVEIKRFIIISTPSDSDIESPGIVPAP